MKRKMSVTYTVTDLFVKKIKNRSETAMIKI